MDNNIILKVKNLHTRFLVGRRKINVVSGVSFEVKKGKTLGIVGESGCGKSVTAHSIMQLLPKLGEIYDGSVTYYLNDSELQLNKFGKNSREIRAVRGNEIAIIFQDPMSSLNPVHKIGKQIMENLLEHEKLSKTDAKKKVIEMLNSLGIPKAVERIKDYPHQFSGGMKQRVIIAIAMICNPKLLIADEPTTALDVTIQAQIIDLMKKMQNANGTSIIIITHNMGIIADMADDVVVMYMGRIVERGCTAAVFENPLHPYTKALLESMPVLGLRGNKKLKSIKGSTPDPSEMPSGCEFWPRCEFAEERCKGTLPPEYDLGNGHMTRCFLYAEEGDIDEAAK